MRNVMLAVAAVALFGCSGISKEQYGAKEAEAAKYKQAVQQETAKVTALEQQNASLKAAAGDLEAKLNEATAAKSELEVTTAKLTEESGTLKSHQTIRLSEQLLFKENASKLTPDITRTLDAVAEAVKAATDKSLIIAGYTDDAEAAGKDPKVRRWQLSNARALEVAKYLVGRGVDPGMIGIAAFGDGRPVAPNDSLANRALNRRVEIGLTPRDLQRGTIAGKPASLKR
jgi:chemotaxis protein MotB